MYNKTMVGRELKMVELKKELEELKKNSMVRVSKKTIISASDDLILKLKVLAAEKEEVRRKLAITAKELATTATEKENVLIATLNVLDDLQIEKEKLAEAKAKEEAIFGSVPDGVVAVDLGGRIIRMNMKAAELLGWSEKEILGKHFTDCFQLADEKGSPTPIQDHPFQKALVTTTTTTTTTTTLFLTRKNGEQFPIILVISTVVLAGKVVGLVSAFRDITKEREVDKAKTEFVSLASHQLRTPLTGIEWTIELFSKKEKLTTEGKKYLADIHFSASRLSALIKLLLNVSRIESGNIGVVPEPLDLVELINEYMREHLMLCNKGKISFIFAEHPEKLMATTDKNLVGFILQNVMANAIEYTQPGGKVEILLEEKQNSVFLVTVRDTGVGIPKTEQARIFEKFVRASNAITIKPDGTGLGLYITQESVKLLGGKIWFESVEGKGSTFYVELPVVAQPHGGEKGIVLLNQKDKV